MKIESHLDKFHRLDDARQRLDPVQDCELWIWTCMNAGVHLLNAALHRIGATEATDSFHTQVEGLYVRPDRISGQLIDAVHPPGDVMHFGQPPIAAPLPDEVRQAGAALRVIEDMREPYVRGDATPSREAIAAAEAAYRDCVRLLGSVLATAL
ncbi:MAG TPA: hypothetical protein VFC24_07490 [Casimicrobiaceae bacterium]|nr:hypothetical protein [Casimicrobiaceae bacterium]